MTASQRIFLGTSPDDVALKAALATQQTSFGAELARFYASPQGVYGRLGIGLFSFVPGGTPYWRISLTLGILPKPELPWDVRLYLTVFASFDRRNDSSLLALESNRFHALTSTTRLIVGGFFTWGQVMRAAVTGEEMLLQFGPAIGIDGGFGRVTLKFPMRIWIDRVPLGTSTGYLSDFDTPAFHASWRYAF